MIKLKNKKEIISSLILFFLIFSVTFELTAFDKSFQKELIEKYSKRENATIENEKFLEFFKTGKMQLNMTTEELSHMQDVKRLNDWFKWTIVISALLFGIIMFFTKDIAKVLKSMIIPLTLFTVLILLAIVIPEQMFSMFHTIFFPQGNYLFPDNSVLITLYPAKYFYFLFYKIAIRTIMATTIAIMIGYILKRHFSKTTFFKP